MALLDASGVALINTNAALSTISDFCLGFVAVSGFVSGLFVAAGGALSVVVVVDDAAVLALRHWGWIAVTTKLELTRIFNACTFVISATSLVFSVLKNSPLGSLLLSIISESEKIVDVVSNPDSVTGRCLAFSLNKKLGDWVARGLISLDQADRIRQHESSDHQTSWILSGTLILGAVVICIGLVSLIAANWENVPDAVKLGANFALLIGLVWGADRSWAHQRMILFETLLVILILSCLGSIGLISQIFHTGGKLEHALLFWCFITLPVSLLARRSFVPLLWTGAFIGSTLFTLLQEKVFQAWVKNHAGLVVMDVPMLVALIWILLTVWARARQLAHGFGTWAFLLMLLASVSLEFSDDIGGFRRGFDLSSSEVAKFLVAWILPLTVCVVVLLHKSWSRIQRSLVAGVIGVFSVLVTMATLHWLGHFSAAIGTALVLLAAALCFASFGRRSLFQLFLTLVGMRFLILYFQALGGLAYTGWGLVVSGSVVIAAAVVWQKNRRMITDWAEKRLT
jgi:hypothetical protein